MRISVFGLGYVGTVTTACLARLGHRLVGVDVSGLKVEALGRGKTPISEPGLGELLAEGRARGAVRATTDAAEAVAGSDVALVCVGTPSTATGGVDDRHLTKVVAEIRDALAAESRPFTVMVRSTCLPAVHARLREVLRPAGARGGPVHYVCHPEYLREGTAVADFLEPPKVVFGVEGPGPEETCRALYPGLAVEPVFVPVDVAALSKYADNCFHALKVTFANEMGLLCKALGVDSRQVMDLLCRDDKLNISPRYLRPGAPFGGSCLPKDLRAVLDQSRQLAVATPMLSGVAASNRNQVDVIVARVLDSGVREVGIVGLAFKEDTDDLRESPAVAVAEQLLGKGLALRIYDSSLSVDRLIGANRAFALRSIPHLASLLFPDPAEVFARSGIVLAFHRIPPELLADPGARAKTLDFTGRNRGSEGVYW